MEEFITHYIDGYIVKEYKGKNIFIIENAIDYNLCDKTIELIDKSVLDIIHHGPKNNVESFVVKYISNKKIEQELTNVMKKVFDTVVCNFVPSTKKVDRFQLRKVFGKTRRHSDGTVCEGVRSVTIVFCLNDDFDEGIYNFPTQNVSFKPKKGSAVFFPPFWTHPHEVSKMENGKFRYIFSSWGKE